jgi:hypothetical protein
MGPKWEYLTVPEYKVRQWIATYYLKDLPLVIEVGPYKSPVSEFLPESVDFRYVEPLEDGRTLLDLCLDGCGCAYGVAVLGLDLQGAESQLPVLADLIDRAEYAVVEAARDYDVGMKQMALLEELTAATIVTQMDIRLPMVRRNGYETYADRHLKVFEAFKEI